MENNAIETEVLEQMPDIVKDNLEEILNESILTNPEEITPEVTRSKMDQINAITTVDDIILELTSIVKYAIDKNSKLGYFAILYCYVTKQIKIEIGKKTFEDNDRMEKLDVEFAKRYIRAFYAWLEDPNTINENLTESWKIAFDFASNNSSMMIQHILLGINAHINLDLGLCTSQVTFPGKLTDIWKDYNTINDILAKLTDTVENFLADNSLYVRLIKKYGKNAETLLANFSIDVARSGAWYFASEFAHGNYNNILINERDEKIAKLATKITDTGNYWINFLLSFGSSFESPNVAQNLKNMEQALKLKVEASI